MSGMEFTQYPLVQTKTILPAIRSNIVERTDLLSRALGAEYPVLLLVCAPAGYGKTTFLNEFARARQDLGWKIAWYSIDADDSRQNTFGEYFFQSIHSALGDVAGLAQTNRILRGAAAADLTAMIPALINALSCDGRPLLIVLDDFHLVNSEEVMDAVSLLVEHAPRNIRIAIGTRAEPDLPLSRFRVRGQCFDVTSFDLNFDLDETARFLNGTMNLALSEEQIQNVREKTEGWAAGLQLAAISVEKSRRSGTTPAVITGSHSTLADFLLSEVFDGLSEETQNFLLRTSILDRMCIPLCAAVAGSDIDCEAAIADLDRKNLFLVALDEKHEWFRYHHLFRDFLQSRLTRKDPAAITHLHRAACQWLAGSGYLREAAGHAFAGEDWDYAAKFVEAYCFSLIIHSEIAALTEWMARFPEEIIRERPLLCMYQCWSWVFSFRMEKNELIEDRLRLALNLSRTLGDERVTMEIEESAKVIHQMMAMAPNPLADPALALRETEALLADYQREDASQFSFLLNIGYARMALGEVSEARISLQKARELAVNARLFFGIVETSFHLARLACVQGEFSAGLAICDVAKRELIKFMPDPERMLPGIGGLDIAAGCILLEQGKIEEAETRLVKGLDLVGWGMNQHYVLVGCLALFSLYESLGRSEDAEMRLAYLASLWPDISFLTDGLDLKARLRRYGGNQRLLKEAEAWCRDLRAGLVEFHRMPGIGPFGACEAYYESAQVWMELNVLLGHGDAILPELDAMIRQARSAGMKTRYVRLEKIEDSIKGSQSGSSRYTEPDGNLISPLTGREIEILCLMAGGASNQEIADHYVISVGTVKSHVNHILTKLDVKSRTQAAARGRELGLVT